MSDALRGLTNINALSTVGALAGRFGALNRALRLLAFDVAEGILGFLAGRVAHGWLADGVAGGLAHRTVALPVALGVTLGGVLGDDLAGGDSEEKG